jgi:hypothetical protein
MRVAAVTVLIHAATRHDTSARKRGDVMRTKKLPPGGNREVICGEDFEEEERSRETERMLTAIARAIAIGRLPPDDAFAWARIAASLVKDARMSEAGGPCRSIGETTH